MPKLAEVNRGLADGSNFQIWMPYERSNSYSGVTAQAPVLIERNTAVFNLYLTQNHRMLRRRSAESRIMLFRTVSASFGELNQNSRTDSVRMCTCRFRTPFVALAAGRIGLKAIGMWAQGFPSNITCEANKNKLARLFLHIEDVYPPLWASLGQHETRRNTLGRRQSGQMRTPRGTQRACALRPG
jgi:hypothetical protein